MRKLFAAAAGTAAALTYAVIGVASAAAQVPSPPFGPPYQALTACPLSALAATEANPMGEDYDFFGCAASVSSGGTFTIGKTTVTLTKPQEVQNGFITDPDETDPNTTFVPVAAENGKTFVAQPETVPGGLTGIHLAIPPTTNPLHDLIVAIDAALETGPLGVTAQPRLAGPNLRVFDPFAILFGPPLPVVSVPIKIKLSNPILGSNCFIGSNANPIVLNLVATNPGSLTFLNDPNGFPVTIIDDNGATLQDTTFSVPKATGCGPLGLLNGAINSKLKLPSASGNNSTTLTGVNSVAAGANDTADFFAGLAASQG